MEQYRLKYNSPSTIPETLASKGITLNSQPTLPQILSIIEDYEFVKNLYEPIDYTWIEIESRENSRYNRKDEDTLVHHIKDYEEKIRQAEIEEKKRMEEEAERQVIEELKAKKVAEMEKIKEEQERKDREELEKIKEMEFKGELDIVEEVLGENTTKKKRK